MSSREGQGTGKGGGDGERPRRWRLRGSVGTETRQCPLNSASLAWMMQRGTGQQRWDVAVEGAQATRGSILPTSVYIGMALYRLSLRVSAQNDLD